MYMHVCQEGGGGRGDGREGLEGCVCGWEGVVSMPG